MPPPHPPALSHTLRPRYNFDLNKGGISLSWFNGAETNVCYNCVDRHVKEGNGDRVAFFWEGNDVDQATTTTYKQLQDMVCQVRACKWGPGCDGAGIGRARAPDAHVGAAARPHGATTRPPAGHVRPGVCACAQACTPATPAMSASLHAPTSPRRTHVLNPAHKPRPAPPDRHPQIANYMKSQGVGKGDDVTIYMPMIPEVRLVRS